MGHDNNGLFCTVRKERKCFVGSGE